MRKTQKKRVVILHCDAKGQNKFIRNGKNNLHLGELSAAIVKDMHRDLEPDVCVVLDKNPITFIAEGEQPAGIIIPGSLYEPTKEAVDAHLWIQQLIRVVENADKLNIPLLGICFGHQLIGAAAGVYAEKFDERFGAEVGISQVRLTSHGRADKIFRGVSTVFDASFFHYYRVRRMPAGLVRLAGNNDCFVQAMRLGSVVGVQFHPDYDLENTQMLLRTRAEILKQVLNDRQVRHIGNLEENLRVYANFLVSL